MSEAKFKVLCANVLDAEGNSIFDATAIKEVNGVKISVQKRVPVRAGMAGGSADAAGVLVGMNELYHAHLSMSELCALGAKIGADVPFALMGGTCRVQGVGDLIRALPPCPQCWFLVVMPSVGISTPEALMLSSPPETVSLLLELAGS